MDCVPTKLEQRAKFMGRLMGVGLGVESRGVGGGVGGKGGMRAREGDGGDGYVGIEAR